MFRAMMILCFGVSAMGLGAPECLIDADRESIGLVGVISGEAKGFNPGPVYITVTNAGKQYTTVIHKAGKWAVVYANPSAETGVECWQGWPGRDSRFVSLPGKPR